ncbi:MAG: PASTA domain-containing protein, partial [Solirubrobacteraceae bacterium]
LAAYQQAQAQATNGSGEMSAVRPPEEHERRSWVLWGWVALVVLLIAGAAAAAYFLTRPKQVLVPKVIGEQISTAQATVRQAKFQVATVSVPNHKPRGIVVAESPAAGTTADKGSTVTLSVSSGPGNVTVPTVQGLSEANAKKALTRAGLKVGNVVRRPSDQFEAGEATATNPGVGRGVPRGFTVTLFVSLGAPQKQVPSVVGETQTQAVSDLTRAGFTFHVRNQPSTTVPVGNVISQSPAGNTKAANGSAVTITVATAPPTVTVPNVVGDPAAGAVSALTAAGLKPNQTTRTVTKPSNNGVVVDQNPSGNSTAKKGSTVTIVVGVLSPASSSTTTSTTKTTTSPTTSTTTTTSSHSQ